MSVDSFRRATIGRDLSRKPHCRKGLGRRQERWESALVSARYGGPAVCLGCAHCDASVTVWRGCCSTRSGESWLEFGKYALPREPMKFGKDRPPEDRGCFRESPSLPFFGGTCSILRW